MVQLCLVFTWCKLEHIVWIVRHSKPIFQEESLVIVRVVMDEHLIILLVTIIRQDFKTSTFTIQFGFCLKSILVQFDKPKKCSIHTLGISKFMEPLQI